MQRPARMRASGTMAPLDGLHGDAVAVGADGGGVLELGAAVLHAAFDHLELSHLPLDLRELAAQDGDGLLEVVALHMRADLLEGEADLLHDADGVEILELLGAVVAVAVRRVGVRGTEEADAIVKKQRLAGDVLLAGELADGEKFFHKPS